MQQPSPLSVRVPRELDMSSYDRVRERMTTTRNDLPSALVHITDDFSYDLGSFHERAYDTSFTRQMHELKEHEPQLIVCALSSAAPVATAVRNFYHYIREPSPYIAGITANQQASCDYYDLPLFRDADPLAIPKKQAEIARLTNIRKEHRFERVAIIDQFVASGRTMSYAAALLRLSGFKTVHGMQGRWYEESAEHVAIGTLHAPSRHAGFMKCIGRTAAQTRL